MNQKLSILASYLPSAHFVLREDISIYDIVIDSRKITQPKETLFVAIKGGLTDGHIFIRQAYEQGVRSFLVTDVNPDKYRDANFIVVEDTLYAMQEIARSYCASFQDLVKIGIIGSNGKTIIKEWLYQMLFDLYRVVKNPKSYNSQVGVPLSIFGITKDHNLGIFEAGISQVGEMDRHVEMLRPQVVLISNIGSAHDEGFEDRSIKLKEKLYLAKYAQTVIYCKDHQAIDSEISISLPEVGTITWGKEADNNLVLIETSIVDSARNIIIKYKGKEVSINFHFVDDASLENIMHCLCVFDYLGIEISMWQAMIRRVSGLHMRLEMTSGIKGSVVINDAYSADLDALKIALNFMDHQLQDRKKLVILSSLDQSGMEEAAAIKNIAQLLKRYSIFDMVYLSSIVPPSLDGINVIHYRSLHELLADIDHLDVTNKAILVKGARKYRLEEITKVLSERGHSATLTFNMQALENNIRAYATLINAETGIIAVVKASAYGSGITEVASILAKNKVSYLAVAFADEGIAIRNANIDLPILVLNPDQGSLRDMIAHKLEPEVYDLDQLRQLASLTAYEEQTMYIHLKLDTGMHRLGFFEYHIEELISILNSTKWLKVATIFTHLASSEDSEDDGFTRSQFDKYDKLYDIIYRGIGYRPKRHVLNSAGISRFSQHQYDYVRLGIGMYGIDQNPLLVNKLEKVHSLSARIIQIKSIGKGESVGYNRRTVVDRPTKIGIVNIGYADGLPRNIGNRAFNLFVNEYAAPILGNVCMDLTIIDLTEVPEVYVGSEVTIFNGEHPIENLASIAGTIPYEVLSRISERVNRKFVL